MLVKKWENIDYKDKNNIWKELKCLTTISYMKCGKEENNNTNKF
jgi:hypothetical protein